MPNAHARIEAMERIADNLDRPDRGQFADAIEGRLQAMTDDELAEAAARILAADPEAAAWVESLSDAELQSEIDRLTAMMTGADWQEALDLLNGRA